MKLSQLIEEGVAQLDAAKVAFGHGTLNAHDEATWLILWQLQMPLDMEVSPETSVDAAQALACQNLILQRIATRKPAAYLTQEAWLQGIPFYVDERSIVPRSFIAELIADGAFDGWLKESSHQFLDLCTGNGSLAILCAMAFPDVKVVGLTFQKTRLPLQKSMSRNTTCKAELNSFKVMASRASRAHLIASFATPPMCVRPA
jgi:ribosomal protein L3 glutamine methyltransferase